MSASSERERPILFSGAMVRALLAGTKTQTRRIVKGQALSWLDDSSFSPTFVAHPENHLCPYGVPGDRLWVRETWRLSLAGGFFVYRADPGREESTAAFNKRDPSIAWKPSIYMPRAASRITLEISDVRVERLQDISQADAMAEGAPPSHPSIDVISREHGYEDFSRSWYAQLWDQINGPGSWDANPWVWVVCFRKL